MSRGELFLEIFRHMKAILVAIGEYFAVPIHDLNDLKTMAKQDK